MSKYLEQRVQELFDQVNCAILVTCGPAGPQVSYVAFGTPGQVLTLSLSRGSDHLFNLETETEIVLLSPIWKLYGRAMVVIDTTLSLEQPWHVVVQVNPIQLHILSEDRQSVIETIDL